MNEIDFSDVKPLQIETLSNWNSFSNRHGIFGHQNVVLPQCARVIVVSHK